jgi:hypothetical protein
MRRDIDMVIEELQRRIPQIACEQLRVANPGADDDGLWFFTHPDNAGEVQLESSTGNLPFLIEGSDSDVRDEPHSVAEAVALVAARLDLGMDGTG